MTTDSAILLKLIRNTRCKTLLNLEGKKDRKFEEAGSSQNHKFSGSELRFDNDDSSNLITYCTLGQLPNFCSKTENSTLHKTCQGTNLNFRTRINQYKIAKLYENSGKNH